MGSINLYNRIRAFIHVPNSLGEHDYPLYKRAVKKMDGSDNYVDTDEHDWESAAARDKEWSSQIGATYSSPRNVRRLFIGVNTVVVHFWSPIVKNGVQGSSLVLKQRYRDRIEASELGAMRARVLKAVVFAELRGVVFRLDSSVSGRKCKE